MEICVADADVHVKKVTTVEEEIRETVREENPITETAAEDLKKNPERKSKYR